MTMVIITTTHIGDVLVHRHHLLVEDITMAVIIRVVIKSGVAQGTTCATQYFF